MNCMHTLPVKSFRFVFGGKGHTLPAKQEEEILTKDFEKFLLLPTVPEEL